MNSSFLDSLTVAAILVGTVVGAGYASGRELWEFYAAYGPVGLFSSFATGLLIGFAGYRALSRSPDARSYASFSAGWPSSLALALDAVGTLFLVVTLAATIAAAAALASSIRGLGFTQGLLLFAFLIGLLSLRGVRSLAPVHGLLVPYIILFFITLLIKEGSLALPEREPSPALPFPFVWAAILYAAYNFLPALGALLALDPDLKIRGHRGALLGGLTLACLSAMGVFLLLRHPSSAGEALPFLAVVRRLGPPWSIAYQAVLLAALVTTALSSQVALQQRLRLSSPLAAPLPLLVAVPLAFLGLPWIVRRLYPLAGAASLAILVFLLWPKRS